MVLQASATYTEHVIQLPATILSIEIADETEVNSIPGLLYANPTTPWQSNVNFLLENSPFRDLILGAKRISRVSINQVVIYNNPQAAKESLKILNLDDYEYTPLPAPLPQVIGSNG